MRIPKREMVITMIDFSAKVGTTNSNIKNNMGRYGLRERNENGDLLIEFCEENELVIGGTLFSHPTIHKATCTESPNRRTENQIGHMMISRRCRNNIQDIGTYRGADMLARTTAWGLRPEQPKPRRSKEDILMCPSSKVVPRRASLTSNSRTGFLCQWTKKLRKREGKKNQAMH